MRPTSHEPPPTVYQITAKTVRRTRKVITCCSTALFDLEKDGQYKEDGSVHVGFFASMLFFFPLFPPHFGATPGWLMLLLARMSRRGAVVPIQCRADT